METFEWYILNSSRDYCRTPSKDQEEKKIYKWIFKRREKKPLKIFHGPYSCDTRPTDWFSQFNEGNATEPVVQHLLGGRKKTVY